MSAAIVRKIIRNVPERVLMNARVFVCRRMHLFHRYARLHFVIYFGVFVHKFPISTHFCGKSHRDHKRTMRMIHARCVFSEIPCLLLIVYFKQQQRKRQRCCFTSGWCSMIHKLGEMHVVGFH